MERKARSSFQPILLEITRQALFVVTICDTAAEFEIHGHMFASHNDPLLPVDLLNTGSEISITFSGAIVVKFDCSQLLSRSEFQMHSVRQYFVAEGPLPLTLVVEPSQ